jgi:hypothetical protein
MKFILLALAIAACTSSSSNGGDDCGSNQVEVDYLGGGARDGETDCKPIPASCGTAGSCADNDCIRDMYDYCESPYIGVGCSDTFQPVLISCNP